VFWRIVLPPSSGLHTTQCNNPENHEFYLHHLKNPKSCIEYDIHTRNRALAFQYSGVLFLLKCKKISPPPPPPVTFKYLTFYKQEVLERTYNTCFNSDLIYMERLAKTTVSDTFLCMISTIKVVFINIFNKTFLTVFIEIFMIHF
jgi:hypothetical protein